MKHIAIFLFFSFLLFATFIKTAWADELQPKVKVDHIANVFEKLKEKVTLFFKFSTDDKFNYHQSLAEKRLAELKYVIESKQGNLIEETSSRYSTYLGSFTDFTIENKLSNKEEELIKMLEEHQKILETLNNFEYESGFWMLMMHDINATKIYSTKARDNL